MSPLRTTSSASRKRSRELFMSIPRPSNSSFAAPRPTPSRSCGPAAGCRARTPPRRSGSGRATGAPPPSCRCRSRCLRGEVRQQLQRVGDHRVRREVVLDGPERVEPERLDLHSDRDLLVVHLRVLTRAAGPSPSRRDDPSRCSSGRRTPPHTARNPPFDRRLPNPRPADRQLTHASSRPSRRYIYDFGAAWNPCVTECGEKAPLSGAKIVHDHPPVGCVTRARRSRPSGRRRCASTTWRSPDGHSTSSSSTEAADPSPKWTCRWCDDLGPPRAA